MQGGFSFPSKPTLLPFGMGSEGWVYFLMCICDSLSRTFVEERIMSAKILAAVQMEFPFGEQCAHAGEHICDCDCHEFETLGIEIDHFLPCCERCGKCRNRIRIGHGEAHRKKCHREGKNLR